MLPLAGTKKKVQNGGGNMEKLSTASGSQLKTKFQVQFSCKQIHRSPGGTTSVGFIFYWKWKYQFAFQGTHNDILQRGFKAYRFIDTSLCGKGIYFYFILFRNAIQLLKISISLKGKYKFGLINFIRLGDLKIV